MSSDQQNKTSQPGNLKKYIFVFVAFIVLLIAAFFVMHSSSSSTLSEVAKVETKPEEAKPEEVVVMKDTELADKKQKLLKDTSGDYYLGEKYAPVVMIEYASLACPHCRDLQESVIDPMIANYVNKGKVKYIFRDYPHNESALVAAKLAHCADSDKYFSFIKVLFKSQDQWAYSENYRETLKSVGKLGGVDDAKFEQCQKDKELDEKILTTVKLGIYINGNAYEGKREYNDVAAYIDTQLKGE